jgi:calcium-dependent protein kinase
MHRDIKPENIMFSIKGDIQTLKIVDYGLVTNCNVKMLSYAKCGTPGYVAPEVANLTDPTMVYDKVCDIFSLGVILYKM